MGITAVEARISYRAAIVHAAGAPGNLEAKTMATRSTLKAVAFGGAVAAVLGAAALPARAHEVETGTVMVCDTQKQVERFVALFEGDAQAAISAVNAEEQDPTACAVLEVAYVSGPQVG